MALSRADFRARYPEFATAADTHVDAALAEAERFTSDGWGADRDDIVALQAAHILAISPMGRDARLSAKDGSSTYLAQYERRAKAHACANPLRVG